MRRSIPTISIPEGAVSGPVRHRGHGHGHNIDSDAAEKARRFLERPRDVPFFAPEGRGEGGSNWWIISGRKTESRNAMLASDPHLSLSSPSVFHEVHLNVRRGHKQEPLNVYGVGFPGVPGVVHGFNDRIMWGSTVNPMDVTDYYQERVVADSLGRLHTFFRGALEPIVVIPETYRVNAIGDGVPNTLVNAPAGSVPPATLVVPRRNNGPLVTAPSGSPLTAISVQYTGFSATREIETFLRFGRAGTVEEFRQALQSFDVGSQNWAYADVDGNIAYFTSAELPLREDLQADTVDGLPPYFIRDGTGTLRHEWIRKDSRPADQAIAYEILPFEEMPQLRQPGARLHRQREQRPDRRHARQQPAQQAARRRPGHPLPLAGLCDRQSHGAHRPPDPRRARARRPPRRRDFVRRHDPHPGGREAARRRGADAVHPARFRRRAHRRRSAATRRARERSRRG